MEYMEVKCKGCGQLQSCPAQTINIIGSEKYKEEVNRLHNDPYGQLQDWEKYPEPFCCSECGKELDVNDLV